MRIVKWWGSFINDVLARVCLRKATRILITEHSTRESTFKTLVIRWRVVKFSPLNVASPHTEVTFSAVLVNPCFLLLNCG